jgi:hypothetical protein
MDTHSAKTSITSDLSNPPRARRFPKPIANAAR